MLTLLKQSSSFIRCRPYTCLNWPFAGLKCRRITNDGDSNENVSADLDKENGVLRVEQNAGTLKRAVRDSLEKLLASQEALVTIETRCLKKRKKSSSKKRDAAPESISALARRLEPSRAATSEAFASFVDACAEAGESLHPLAMNKMRLYVDAWRKRVHHGRSSESLEEEQPLSFGDQHLYATLAFMAASSSDTTGGLVTLRQVLALMEEEGLRAQKNCLAHLLRAGALLRASRQDVSFVFRQVTRDEVNEAISHWLPLENDQQAAVKGARTLLWEDFQFKKMNNNDECLYVTPLLQHFNVRDTSRYVLHHLLLIRIIMGYSLVVVFIHTRLIIPS